MDLTPLRCWSPPANWTTVSTLDLHTEGEPLRILTGGLPKIPGDTILAKRRWARENLDPLRKALMWEPRGHADMYGCIVTEPVTPEADFGVLFLHNEGFSTMCGHGIIGVTTAAVETGLTASSKEPEKERQRAGEVRVCIDTPAGFVEAWAQVENRRVASVRFRNVPSFLAQPDARVDVPGMGRVRYDLAFGGAFYAYVDAPDISLRLTAENSSTIIAAGRAIKKAVMDASSIEHPVDADLGFLYGVIFVGPPEDPAHHSRNVCVFAEGEVDRSPTGTGVSGRVAIHHARGELATGEDAVIESLLGTTFTARVADTTTFGPYDAVIPEVTGRAWITGQSMFTLDPADPLVHGFILR
ncbi:MAG: proline racemase family protein [Rubricoccaceae bacterium]